MSAQKKTRRRFQRTRRGSVIILAVAVIAVLAVLAAAYVTVIKLERNSVTAYSDNVSYQQQVTAMVSEIRAILTADLYGNKVVNSTTPRRADPTNPLSPSVWPFAFEDGEFFDYPQVAMNNPSGNELTFDNRIREQREGNPQPSNIESILRLDPAAGPTIAYPDDAWLSSTEPVRQQDSVGDFFAYLQEPWDTWPQITNLRSAFRLRDFDLPPDGEFDAWVRDDGLFADLGQFFVQNEDNRGNPAADLSIDWSDPGLPTSSENGPWLGVDQDVYDLQKGELADPSDPEIRFERADERFWVDVDHDGFPDARWQELDALGNLFGLRWVIAARIIDNSAMANINTHLSGTPVENPSDGGAADKHFATGLTPADVDFNRLLRVFASDPWDRRHPDLRFSQIEPNNLAGAFLKHVQGESLQETGGFRLQSGLDQLREIFQASTLPDSRDVNPYLKLTTVPQFNPPNPSQQDNYVADGQAYIPFTGPNRLQREVFYRHAAADPDGRRLTRLSFLPQSDETDLRAYWGFNYERVLSKIEQRLDKFEGFDGLPGSGDDDDPARRGIMRSRMPGGFGTIARDPSPGVSPPMTTENRIERIQKDFRRHLTTISGEGQASPVPNFSSSSAITRKVPVNDFPNLPPQDASKLKDDLIRRSYDALIWALAPLAAETGDRRLFRGVNGGIADQSFHYGGGAGGPAARLGSLTAQPTGAAYAVLRAASMAVNLADAVDFEGGFDHPTIARLFPTPSGVTSPVANITTLTTALPFGEIQDRNDDPAMLPELYMGDINRGVTIVGLERQPFIRGAMSLALYQHDRVSNPAGEAMPIADPTALESQIGSIIAVELGNPWPDPINMGNTRIVITDGSETFELNPTAVEQTPIAGDGQSTIQPGQTRVYYLPSFNAGTPAPTEDWESAVIEFVAQATAEGAAATELSQAAVLTNIGTISTPTNPISFDTFSQSGAATVLLIQNVPNKGDFIIDRLTTNAGVFPRFLSAPRSHTFTGTDMGTFRFAAASSIRRPTANIGFPSYLVERPGENAVFVRESPTDAPEQVWTLPGGAPPAGDLVRTVEYEDALSVGSSPNSLNNPPNFQLLVPNGPLEYQSELLQISPFATTYIHSGRANGGVSVDPGLDRQPPIHPGTTPGTWTTFSEHLGAPWNYEYITGVQNPYLGLLDPSRFILNEDLGLIGKLPDTMKVPLATRILDCFEVMDADKELVRGRININTAPRAILELLPQIDFRNWQTTAPINMLGNFSPDPMIDRVRMIEEYRTRLRRSGTNPPDPFTLTSLNGLRPRTASLSNDRSLDPLDVKGFVNLGELSILGKWDANGQITTDQVDAGFMEVAVAPGNQTAQTPGGYALDPRTDVFIPANGDTTRLIPRQDVVNGFDPADDVEERLALFRAISNIASTRSDVFTAWFMIRGYDPAAIEAIEVEGTSDDEINGYLNQLVPTFEERWLAVFDRSNVRTPTDRARVLLLVQLPFDIPLDTQEDEGG